MVYLSCARQHVAASKCITLWKRSCSKERIQVTLKACAHAVQSTNPLARCVEYLQGDVDTMTTEFNFWAEERRRFQVKGYMDTLSAAFIVPAACGTVGRHTSLPAQAALLATAGRCVVQHQRECSVSCTMGNCAVLLFCKYVKANSMSAAAATAGLNLATCWQCRTRY